MKFSFFSSSSILRKFLILFRKSSISFKLKAFDKDNIGFRCFIFLNLLDGAAPISLEIEPYFFKNLFFFSKSITSIFNLSNTESVTDGESFV